MLNSREFLPPIVIIIQGVKGNTFLILKYHVSHHNVDNFQLIIKWIHKIKTSFVSTVLQPLRANIEVLVIHFHIRGKISIIRCNK